MCFGLVDSRRWPHFPHTIRVNLHMVMVPDCKVEFFDDFQFEKAKDTSTVITCRRTKDGSKHEVRCLIATMHERRAGQLIR